MIFNILKRIIFFLYLFPIFLFACNKKDNSIIEQMPSNLVIEVKIVGTTTAMPNGDGSGIVNLTLSGKNVSIYQIILPTENKSYTINGSSGTVQCQFSSSRGTTTVYKVQIKAVKDNYIKDTTISITVYRSPMQLVWSDEFEYTGLPDATKWSYDTQGNATGWGNNEAQYYTTNDLDNAYVENGILHIKAIKETVNGKEYTSARLLSKQSWLYGKIEVRAKLPTGKGTWPAIWMLPTDWAYGNWPKSGEIDIMENVGYDPNVIVGSVHTEKYNHVINTQKNATIQVPTCYTGFHVYGLEWDKEECRIYVDGEKYFTFSNEHKTYMEWPFDKQFHLLLNLAIGGNWGGLQGIDDTKFPHIFEIDYVRVYQ